MVQQMGVDKDVTSDNEGWTAKDFAEHFEQREMLVLLETL